MGNVNSNTVVATFWFGLSFILACCAVVSIFWGTSLVAAPLLFCLSLLLFFTGRQRVSAWRQTDKAFNTALLTISLALAMLSSLSVMLSDVN